MPTKLESCLYYSKMTVSYTSNTFITREVFETSFGNAVSPYSLEILCLLVSTFIGDSVFSGCLDLVSMNVNNKNSYYTSIDGVLFTKNSETIRYFPTKHNVINNAMLASAATIGDSAFSVCSNLESIKNPTNVTLIRNSAFYECSKLQSITIPSSVTSISNEAFSKCYQLASIAIPASTICNIKHLNTYIVIKHCHILSFSISYTFQIQLHFHSNYNMQ